MNHRRLVLIDVETTGGSSSRARITEIGGLRVEHGQVVATYRQLLNPETPIPRFITKLTGISNEMAWQAPLFSAVAEELEQFLTGAIFVAHHVAFDYGFIKAEFKRVGINYGSDRLCSVRLSRLMHPEQGRHGLDKIIARLGLSVAHRHRAFDDAEVIWKFIEDELLQNEIKLFMALDKVMVHSRRPQTPELVHNPRLC